MNFREILKLLYCYTLIKINISLIFQPDYDDIEDDYSRAIKHPMNEEKRSKHDDRKKYGEE